MDSGATPPRLDPSLSKYSSNVPVQFIRIFGKNKFDSNINLIAAAFSQASWRSLEAAWNCFISFTVLKGFPSESINQLSASQFINFMLTEKNLKHSTAESYLSSLSTIFKLKGADCSCLHSYHSKILLKGGKILSSLEGIPTPSRKVFSLDLLQLLGHEIAIADWPIDSKRVFWSACTTLFFGSLRVGEILSCSDSSFASSSCLLWKDVKFRGDSILVHIKLPKVKSKEGDFVDIFPFSISSCCPVRALSGLKANSPHSSSPDLPVFTFASGRLLTPSNFNETLRLLLLPHLGFAASEYSSHSFRAAISSALARFPDLAQDEDIKLWGRWESSSFSRYTRLGLDKKRSLHAKICSALLCRPAISPQ